MAPDLTFYVLWDQEKWSSDMYFLFLSKVPVNKTQPGSSKGLLWKEMPLYRALFIHL